MVGRVAIGLSALMGSAAAVPFASKATTTVTSQPPFTPSVVPQVNVTSHGPYDGPSPTTTGALSTSIVPSTPPDVPLNPEALVYPADGKLHGPEPMPYTPSGGIGFNGSNPIYKVQSDFDYQSLALALFHEWIELDLFHYGLATFSDEEFDAYGIGPEERHLLQHMGDQEIGHATVLSNMLGPSAPKQCTYNYPFKNVPEYIDFNQKLTRWAEAGVYGFLGHLNSQPAAQLLLQSITIEARQQLIFRQFGGQFPMPEWHTVGIPQSWAWTFLAPYISSCPANQTRLVWQNFPALKILNQPNPARINGSDVWNETATPNSGANSLSIAGIPSKELCVNATNPLQDCKAAISNNRTYPLSYPGRQVFLSWDEPGKAVGPNNSYITSSNVAVPKFAMWVSQLNVTYSPLMNVSVSGCTAYTIQPNISTWQGDYMINGTMFLALTDTDLFVTPYNLTLINPHVHSLAVYQAG